LQAFADREHRQYLHLVDGGVSDNVGMRGVLDVLSQYEALHGLREDPPGLFDVVIKAAGTPIDRYSYDTWKR
jgi:NTE family protein